MRDHLLERPNGCDCIRSSNVGHCRAVLSTVVLLALASNHATAIADTPPTNAAASQAHVKSIHELESISDPRKKCLAAVDSAQRLIGGENAEEWGDFLIGIRDTPPNSMANDDATRALKIAESMRDRLPEKDRKALMSRVSILQRFNAVLLAVAGSTGSTNKSDDAPLMDAASDLAEYLDDTNPALGESARLWQAVAYWRAGKTDRALKILKPIVSAPADARIGLVSRLFRCRLLADTSQQAAALSHCTRIADRMPRWFDSESDETRQAAANTIRGVQINILESWHKKLRAAGDENAAAAVAAQLAEFKEKAPDGSGKERLKLTTTIGGLPPVDAKPERAPATTEPTRD